MARYALVLLLTATSLAGQEDPTKSFFALRSGAAKQKALAEGGGTRQSEAAVARGLRWLALHQAPDGSWSLDQFPKHARKALDAQDYFDDQSTGKGMKNDVAGTAFGLLPFLAAGVTHRETGRKADVAYVPTVKRGLAWLVAHQGRDGQLGTGTMYEHALATIALCEAYGMTADPTLKAPAKKAIDFIIAAQDPRAGGWRYRPQQGSDTSVTGWQIQALKTGQMAGLAVPGKVFQMAGKWLDFCETADRGGFGYVGPTESPTTSAVGLLCRQYLGTPRRNPDLLRGVEKLLKRFPPGALPSSYRDYYVTQVLFSMGGDLWTAWNQGAAQKKGMRDLLIDRQAADGSWDPRGDAHAAPGGRIMQTSLSLLNLEVYYRYPPLYPRLRVDAP